MPFITGMFQSSSTASGICLRQVSSACWPSAASDLEAQILEDPARDLADHAAIVDDQTGLHRSTTFSKRGENLGRLFAIKILAHAAIASAVGIQHIVHVEDDHQLAIEPVNATGDARQPGIEIDRYWVHACRRPSFITSPTELISSP